MLAVENGRRQMISICIAKETSIGRGSAHNSSPTLVLERSRKLSKDEMILRSLNTLTRGGYSYFITFTDDHTWYGYVYLMRYKSEVFGKFKECRLEVENQTGRKIKTLRHTLEMAAKLLNMAPSKTIFQTPYQIWHGKPASYKYGLLGLTSQLDNDPRTYGEVMLDIDSDKRAKAMRSKMDSIVMRGYDFIKNENPCIYKKICGSSVAYLMLYMDVILFVENQVKMLGNIKAWLSTQFSMKDIGTIQYIVQYIRPNVAYALSVMSIYQAYAGEAHWSAVKTILMYLKMTKDMFLIYGGGELILEGYSDASFQSNDDDVKSQSSFIFKLNGGMVAWKSSKHATTVVSTIEVQYIVASEAAKKAIWKENYIQ
ncbi:hypothetical protein Sango_2750700 [Sesamum angolense]|uniref:Gag/pol protein n=1 Tax=Sesamum angolense TaxID=2727404 RepID=A0AAE1W0Y0_9LAMI|nr:hypothetical protein Sango_2750700 [Sesamum angolense]